MGVISGNRGGHGVVPSLLIHLFGNVTYKNRRTSEPQCGGAPSCWKIIHSWNSSEVQRKVPTCPSSFFVMFLIRERLYVHPVQCTRFIIRGMPSYGHFHFIIRNVGNYGSLTHFIIRSMVCYGGFTHFVIRSVASYGSFYQLNNSQYGTLRQHLPT